MFQRSKLRRPRSGLREYKAFGNKSSPIGRDVVATQPLSRGHATAGLIARSIGIIAAQAAVAVAKVRVRRLGRSHRGTGGNASRRGTRPIPSTMIDGGMPIAATGPRSAAVAAIAGPLEATGANTPEAARMEAASEMTCEGVYEQGHGTCGSV